MKTRFDQERRNEAIKLQLAVAFSVGIVLKVLFCVFQVSTVQASTVLKVLN